jgi:hypothetical protein
MKYTVYLMVPDITWEGVEAKTKQEAIKKIGNDPTLKYFDWNEKHKFIVEKEQNNG